MRKTLQDALARRNARCLDGSPPPHRGLLDRSSREVGYVVVVGRDIRLHTTLRQKTFYMSKGNKQTDKRYARRG